LKAVITASVLSHKHASPLPEVFAEAPVPQRSQASPAVFNYTEVSVQTQSSVVVPESPEPVIQTHTSGTA